MPSDAIAEQFRRLAAQHFSVYPEDAVFECVEEGLRKRAERTGNGIRVTIWSEGAATTPVYDSASH
jgi:hypothetical protein